MLRSSDHIKRLAGNCRTDLPWMKGGKPGQ
jgi:hypothetical protein